LKTPAHQETLKKAAQLFSQQNYSPAIKLFTEILNENIEISGAEYHMLAISYGKMHNLSEAVKCFRVAVGKCPGRSAWFNDLGTAL